MAIDQQYAFTLQEMLITLAILSIGVTIGLPSYLDLITNNRMTGAVNDFTADLQSARSEAITRGLEVRICASSCDGVDIQTCNCTGAGPWDQGWIVLVVDTDEVLRIHQALAGEDSLEGNGNVTQMLTFDGNGFAHGDNGEMPNANGNAPWILLCDSDGNDRHARAIEVFFTGQVDLKTHFSDGVTCS